jgi:hypothetical protein
MADTEKRWFEVTASGEFALKVFARDRDEAVKLFWQHEEEIDSILMYPHFLEVTSVVESEADADGEYLPS